jgi:hypothetical protein
MKPFTGFGRATSVCDKNCLLCPTYYLKLIGSTGSVYTIAHAARVIPNGRRYPKLPFLAKIVWLVNLTNWFENHKPDLLLYNFKATIDHGFVKIMNI